MRCRIIVLVALLCVTAPLSAQLENVGSLSFPTSAKPEAQRTDALATYVRLANMRYDEGVTSYLEVLDAERSYLDAEQSFSRTKADLYKSVVGVYRALAGSWLDSVAIESFRIEEVEPRYEPVPPPDTTAQDTSTAPDTTTAPDEGGE